MSFEKGDCERRDGDGEGLEGRWQPDLQCVPKTHTVTRRSEHSLISDDTLSIVIFVYFLWSWIFAYFHLHVRILLTKGYLG